MEQIHIPTDLLDTDTDRGGGEAGASTGENHRLHEPNDQYAGMVDKFTLVIKKRIT